MGRPKGRPNKVYGKPWRDALRKVLHERESKHGPRNFERLARAAFQEALRGKAELVREIGDRIDGKVPQAVTGDAEGEPIRIVARIERTIVKP